MSADSRWISRKYTLQFLTPAFLGGHDQSGQWRTPPFKALLRQWWRVAYAAEQKFQVDLGKMRELEGRLFGNAWLEKQVGRQTESAASRSLVRMRLSRWVPGARRDWQGLEPRPVVHPGVQQPIGAHLYLGYGPLIYDKNQRGTALKAPPAIQEGENAYFSLAFPESEQNVIERALLLMELFGTAGGRSRNGWGSFRLIPEGSILPPATLPLRDWQEALELDWPHCIGKDSGGKLIWRTENTYADWKELMRDLACLKIALWTQFPWGQTTPDLRHWLSYPVTNHPVSLWQAVNLRLPNSLRFKVRCVDGDSKRLIGVIYHMPCSPPPAFNPNPAVLKQVWQQVHRLLDELGKPSGQRLVPQTLQLAVVQQIAGITLKRSTE